MKRGALFTTLAAFGAAFFLFPQTVHAAGFVQDAAGVKYQNDDGSYLADAWVQVGSNIYRLDANGIVQTGWIQVNGLWYFLDAYGVCTNPEGTVQPPAGVLVEGSKEASTGAPETAGAPADITSQLMANAAAAAEATAALENMLAQAGWVQMPGSGDGAASELGISTWVSPVTAQMMADGTMDAAAVEEAAASMEEMLLALYLYLFSLLLG